MREKELKQEARLTLEPHLSVSGLSIAALIPLFHSLTPSLSLSCRAKWLVSSMRVGSRWRWGGQEEVEVVTVPVGD